MSAENIVRVIECDARKLPLDDSSVDAIVTDPPYELGFMGKSWDSTGVAYDPATWREALRILKPGGHLLAFGGSRTWHRLACAIEDAGFELRDNIAWLYGSGFPKSFDVSKAIDKAGCAEREVLRPRTYELRNDGGYSGGLNTTKPRSESAEITAPATDDARRWQGWGTALKPGFEPIVVARKPLLGTVAANVLAHGTGGIHVDGCRVAGQVPTTTQGRSTNIYGGGNGFAPDGSQESIPHVGGRWPTNVVLSHLSTVDGGDRCADGCADGCPVAELDAQSGVRCNPGTYQRSTVVTNNVYGASNDRPMQFGYGDTGGASRFFPTFRYEPKAPSDERPTVDGVSHATVKPLDLIRWLCRLVTPPGGTLLDMFAGSGTMAEAAILEHFDAVVVDNEPTHIPLIELRVERARTKQIPGMSRLGSKKPIEVDPGADLLSWMDDNGAVTP